MRAMAAQPWIRSVRRIFASAERKSRDGAQILGDALGLNGYTVVDELGENDRTATGYLPPEEFEATAEAFFAQPEISIRGWERAIDAQRRIVRAAEYVSAQPPEHADLAIVGHGGTGTLLYCQLARLPISRRYDQPATKGGNWFAFDRATRKVLHQGWQSIDSSPG